MDEFETDGPTDFESILDKMNGDWDDDTPDPNAIEDDEEETTEEETEEDTSEEETDEDSDESDGDDEEGGDEEEDGDEEEETEDEEEPESASDEATVKVEVDGEEKTFTVAELKRLAGQEASLTQKSQAVASQRRSLDTQSQYVLQVLKSRFETAQAEAAKYKDVDLYKARVELDDETFEQLKSAKEGAESNLKAIEEDARNFVQNAQKSRQEMLRAQAQESRKVLKEKIPEWDDKLYGQIREYAVSQGMPSEVVNEIVDPAAVLMMHKARLYDEAKSNTETKVKKKVVKGPKRTARKSETKTDSKASRFKALQRRAQEEGDIDAITELMNAAAE